MLWGGAQAGVRRGPRAQRGGGGGPSKRHLGPDPHLGVLNPTNPHLHQPCFNPGTSQKALVLPSNQIDHIKSMAILLRSYKEGHG